MFARIGAALNRLRDRLDNRNPYVRLPVRRDDGGKPIFEELDVEPLGPNHFRLVDSPGVVEGLARNDHFALDRSSPTGFRILRRSGLVCVWFYFDPPGRNRGPDGDAVRAAVENAGGTCDGGGNTHLVFTVPVTLGFPAIESLFDTLMNQNPGTTWSFGNVFEPGGDSTPLGWWELDRQAGADG